MQRIRELGRDRGGNVLLIFGLGLPVLMGLTSAALEYGSLVKRRTKLFWRSKPKPTLKRKSPDAIIYPERAAPGRAPSYGAPPAGAAPMAPHPALLGTVRMQTSRQ